VFVLDHIAIMAAANLIRHLPCEFINSTLCTVRFPQIPQYAAESQRFPPLLRPSSLSGNPGPPYSSVTSSSPPDWASSCIWANHNRHETNSQAIACLLVDRRAPNIPSLVCVGDAGFPGQGALAVEQNDAPAAAALAATEAGIEKRARITTN
jgi:hypothetical protein